MSVMCDVLVMCMYDMMFCVLFHGDMVCVICLISVLCVSVVHVTCTCSILQLGMRRVLCFVL